MRDRYVQDPGSGWNKHKKPEGKRRNAKRARRHARKMIREQRA